MIKGKKSMKKEETTKMIQRKTVKFIKVKAYLFLEEIC